MAYIIILLERADTECVTLTTKFFALAVAQDHFLSEEVWLTLMSNWWVIVYSSSCPAHDVIDFIDFDWFRQSFWPLFDLKLLFFKPL